MGAAFLYFEALNLQAIVVQATINTKKYLYQHRNTLVIKLSNECFRWIIISMFSKLYLLYVQSHTPKKYQIIIFLNHFLKTITTETRAKKIYLNFQKHPMFDFPLLLDWSNFDWLQNHRKVLLENHLQVICWIKDI